MQTYEVENFKIKFRFLKKCKLQNEKCPKTQFIFATHNPNIPVLGDCEQVIVCEYDNDHGNEDIKKHKINLSFAGIDNKDIQKDIIKILEGGENAFKERKQKYMQWKH